MCVTDDDTRRELEKKKVHGRRGKRILKLCHVCRRRVVGLVDVLRTCNANSISVGEELDCNLSRSHQGRQQ